MYILIVSAKEVMFNHSNIVLEESLFIPYSAVLHSYDAVCLICDIIFSSL